MKLTFCAIIAGAALQDLT